MTKESSGGQTVKEQIIQLVRQENPSDVHQLVRLVTEKLGLDEKRALESITDLVDEGRIKLKQPKPSRENFGVYIRSGAASWFWITIALVIVTTIIVFVVPENAYPIVYVRYVLGAIFVLWLPGYSFVKALFPARPPVKLSSADLDMIERIALSIGMSLALVPMVGLLLNYSPWGIRLTPIVLSLLAFTLTFAVVAVAREYEAKTKSRESNTSGP